MELIFRYKYLLLGAGIFLLNLILKTLYLDFNDIALDEPFTVFFAQGSPSEIIENLKPYNNPPLYELLLHHWMKIFGMDVFNVRLFSCLISCLTSVVLFFVVKKHWNDRVAILAALIFTFSTFQISFAHETRVYSLFFLLTLLSMHFLFLLMEKQNFKNAVYYVLFTTLLLYAHFFSLWVIFIQVLILLVSRKLFQRFFIFSAIAVLILFIPYLTILFERFTETSGKGGTWLEPPTFSALYENIRYFSNKPVNAVLFIVFIFFSLFYFRFKKLKVEKLDFLLIWFFVPFILMFSISFYLPMFLGRYLIFITPAFILLIAVLFESYYLLLGKLKPLIYLPVLLMIITVDLHPSNEQEPEKVAELIKPFYEKGKMIVLSPVSNDLIINYHLDQDLFIYRPDYRNYEKERNIIPENDVKNLKLEEELIFVETAGGGYLDRSRNNYKFLTDNYKEVIPLQIDGKDPKGFSVFHFRGLKNQR